MTDKIWGDHAAFLADMAAEVTKLVLSDDIATAVGDYTEWLSRQCFVHAEKHCQDDKKALSVDERVKSYTRVPGEGWESSQEDVSDLWNENEKRLSEVES